MLIMLLVFGMLCVFGMVASLYYLFKALNGYAEAQERANKQKLDLIKKLL